MVILICYMMHAQSGNYHPSKLSLVYYENKTLRFLVVAIRI